MYMHCIVVCVILLVMCMYVRHTPIVRHYIVLSTVYVNHTTSNVYVCMYVRHTPIVRHYST